MGRGGPWSRSVHQWRQAERGKTPTRSFSTLPTPKKRHNPLRSRNQRPHFRNRPPSSMRTANPSCNRGTTLCNHRIPLHWRCRLHLLRTPQASLFTLTGRPSYRHRTNRGFSILRHQAPLSLRRHWYLQQGRAPQYPKQPSCLGRYRLLSFLRIPKRPVQGA